MRKVITKPNEIRIDKRSRFWLSKDPIEKYEVLAEDLLRRVTEKSIELEKIIEETEDNLKKSLLIEARKRIKMLQGFLESEMRMIKMYYESMATHTGEPPL